MHESTTFFQYCFFFVCFFSIVRVCVCVRASEKMRPIKKSGFEVCCNGALIKREAAAHQFQLHDADAVPEDVGGRPQQLCEGVQSVVFKGRTSDLEKEQAKK